MLLDPPNFLVLDEPTNHLDLFTKEMLIDALRTFEGTMLFVSHDRAFLRALGTRVLEVGGESGANGNRWCTRALTSSTSSDSGTKRLACMRSWCGLSTEVGTDCRGGWYGLSMEVGGSLRTVGG